MPDKFKRLDTHGLANDPEYKQNFGLYLNHDNLKILQDSMEVRNVPYPQRVAFLSQIILEKGGDTDDHGNGAIGLIGWRGERAIGLPPDISGQIHHLFKGTLDTQDKYWTHGGAGTGVNTAYEMWNLFNSTNNSIQATKALMKGYVRPPKEDYEKRLKLLYLIKKYMKE